MFRDTSTGHPELITAVKSNAHSYGMKRKMATQRIAMTYRDYGVAEENDMLFLEQLGETYQ